jgi:hypothetical protein
VVALNALLFNYAMGLLPKDVVEDIQQKLADYNLPRLDGNKYGATDKGFTIIHGDQEISLNHPLGLCEAYAAWRYAKFAHVDNNFLNHAFSACVLRGICNEGDPEFTCNEGDFEGGSFFLAKWGILIEMTGNFLI